MSDTSLLTQRIHRTKTFKEKTGLTFKQIGKLTGLSEQHVCDVLAERKGLSAESTLQLWKLTRSTKAEAEMKLNAGKKIQVRIEHFQDMGQPQPMKLEWVPGLSGSDPNDTGDITDDDRGDDPDIDDTLDFLKNQLAIHAAASAAINDYISKVQSGKVNKTGTTKPARTITDSADSRKPGPKSDLFKDSKEHLKYLTEWR
jgi:hypothetical protein